MVKARLHFGASVRQKGALSVSAWVIECPECWVEPVCADAMSRPGLKRPDAQMLALYLGLASCLMHGLDEVEAHSDAKSVMRQVNGGEKRSKPDSYLAARLGAWVIYWRETHFASLTFEEVAAGDTHWRVDDTIKRALKDEDEAFAEVAA